MKKITGRIMIMAAILIGFAASSCQMDDTLQYNNVTMGNVVDGTLVSDQGNIFNVVEQTCMGRLDTMSRVMVVCDVLKKTDGVADSYDVRLNRLTSVLDKDPIVATQITDEAQKVQDPVYVREMWYSAGYLNMYIMVPVKSGSKARHMINLVFDDAAASGSNYVFELRHNAFGEVWGEDGDDCVLAGAYVSFPIGKIIKGNEAHLTFNWKWHKAAGNAWSLEVVDNQLEFEWKRSAFEQAPLSLASGL